MERQGLVSDLMILPEQLPDPSSIPGWFQTAVILLQEASTGKENQLTHWSAAVCLSALRISLPRQELFSEDSLDYCSSLTASQGECQGF